MKNKRQIGFLFEDIAFNYLVKNKHNVIARNFYSKYGEIDIVVLEKDTIRFVEVKSSMYGKGALEQLINFKKKNSLRLTALEFLNKNPQYQNLSQTFDIIFIHSKTKELEYLPNAIYFDDIS